MARCVRMPRAKTARAGARGEFMLHARATLGLIGAVLTGRRRVYYGWWVLAAGGAVVGLINGSIFWSYGLFIPALEESFGWSRAAVSFGLSASLLAAGLVSPLVGQWVDRRGPRSAILLGGAIIAVSFFALSMITTLWQFYLLMLVNGVGRQFSFNIPNMTLVSRWFERYRSMAAALMGVGLMLGGMTLVPLMRVVIDAVGWDGAFVAIGVATIGVNGALGLLVIRNWPSDMGLEVDGAPRPSADQPPRPPVGGMTLREAVHTGLFWSLTAGIALFVFGMATWIVHAAPFYESVGLSPGWATALVSMTAGLGMITRLIMGVIAGRVRTLELWAMTIMVMLVLAMVILIVSTQPLAIGLFLALFVIAFGGGGAMFQALLLPNAFGVAHYATILGVVSLVETLGIVIGPTTAGAIFDATGSYDWAVVMIAVIYGLGGLAFLLAARQHTRMRAAGTAVSERLPLDPGAGLPTVRPDVGG